MLVIMDDKKKLKMVNILDTRYFGESWRLRYRTKWQKAEQPNRHWYFTDEIEFENA